MTTLPTVSIVIVSWNARDYLAECLSSLTSDVYAGPMEVVVVDNASGDGSPEMVRREFPDVTLICNDRNLGFAKACNIGIRCSAGQYVALVNSDVHVLKHCIDTLVAYCERSPRVGMIGPRIVGRDGLQQCSCRGFPRLRDMLFRALALDLLFPNARWCNGYLLGNLHPTQRAPVDILSGCFWLVRRRALDDVGLLDEAFFIYGEDMDWCKRFWAAGWPLAFVPEAQAVHYGGASSANAPVRFFIEMQRAEFQYWSKHYPGRRSRGYFAIACLHHAARVAGYSVATLVCARRAAERWHKARCSVACLKWMATVLAQDRAATRTGHELPY